MLATQGDVPKEALADFAMVGELALSGEVRRVRGVLSITMTMKEAGRKSMLVPFENAEEAAYHPELVRFIANIGTSSIGFLNRGETCALSKSALHLTQTKIETLIKPSIRSSKAKSSVKQ